MSNRLLVRPADRIAMPALVVPRMVLCYRGVWNGAADFRGRLLVEGRRRDLDWVDIQSLLDGEWDGQPATAMLAVTHLIGFGVGGGKVVIPGSQTWTSSGSHSVSDYNRLEVAVWGGGGGGAGLGGANTGELSRYNTSTPVRGNGGKPGTVDPANGAGGTASGGDSNVTGETGGTDGTAHGGDAASGSGTLLGTLTGGPGGTSNQASGTAPGGGASRSNSSGGNGGGGGLAVKLWNYGDAGAPSPGGSVTVEVGDGGSGFGSGSDGARGEVRAQWD